MTGQPEPKRSRGRPKSNSAMTSAERQRAYRARQRERQHGYVLVPIKPTVEMLMAANWELGQRDFDAATLWRAFIDAVPRE